MKKNISLLFLMGFTLVTLCLITACNKEKKEVIDPFNNGSNERNMTIVISDLHLGADLAYAEIKTNLKPLENFLNKINASPNVRELVIAGDMLDEWFVPATTDTYNGKDQHDFVQRIAIANKGVIDAFNRIIQGGKISVTYVPGNHDLTITAENVASILPGIIQARDEVQGVGTYSPAGNFPLAIEHGHRYNFFCAPDPFSNQDIAPGTIMPPGYFFTRIAALHISQDSPPINEVIPVVTPNTLGGESQALLFRYWKLWDMTTKIFPILNKFDEKIITTNIDGFTGNYSVNDLLPYQLSAGGLIEMYLYNGVQDTWEERQTHNKVAVHISVAHAIDYAADSSETDNQAKLQYFMNPDSDKRIVVFGHSHAAKIISSLNHLGQKSIYANSGTWIDNNPKRKTMNFVVITPQNADASSLTYVRLYNFEGEIVTTMAEESVRL